jgi:Ca2+-binding RTX toxin-like protein
LITFALVNSQTNEVVEGYEDLGATPTINLSEVDLTQFNLVARVNPNHPDADRVQSVQFISDLGNRVESMEPFALFGDNGGNFRGKALTTGQFTVQATAYTESGAKGSAIATTALDYTVVDTVQMGTNRADELQGTDGVDQLTGLAGNDQLFGAAGDDLLSGGAGNDLLTGGTGADLFLLAIGEGQDTIADFTLGEDMIGLTGGLSLGQIDIIAQNNQTLIRAGQDTLATLTGVNADELTAAMDTAFKIV